MSEKREFPILNGKLLSDLDLNGHKLIGLTIPEGGGGGSSVEVVEPSPDGAGKAADAAVVFERFSDVYERVDQAQTSIGEVANQFLDLINQKQDALNAEQMAAVNSGATKEWKTAKDEAIDVLQKDTMIQADLIGSQADLINRKIPLYTSVGATEVDGDLYLHPFSRNEVSNTLDAMTIASVERKSSDGSLSFASGIVLDCSLVIDCRGRETAPTITWGANFHPRTDAETDFACVAGVRNVYWITEYAPNEFTVAGWAETTGGNAS